MSVQWAFGYGLSYTTFAYDRLSVNKPSFTAGDELVFTVDVTNTGDKAGKESVLLFESTKTADIRSQGSHQITTEKQNTLLTCSETKKWNTPNK